MHLCKKTHKGDKKKMETIYEVKKILILGNKKIKIIEEPRDDRESVMSLEELIDSIESCNVGCITLL